MLPIVTKYYTDRHGIEVVARYASFMRKRKSPVAPALGTGTKVPRSTCTICVGAIVVTPNAGVPFFQDINKLKKVRSRYMTPEIDFSHRRFRTVIFIGCDCDFIPMFNNIDKSRHNNITCINM